MCDLINIAFFSIFLSSYPVAHLSIPLSTCSLTLSFPFICTHSSLLSLSCLLFLSLPLQRNLCALNSPIENCLIWKLIKSVFICELMFLFSSQARLSGWETAVTLSQMNFLCMSHVVPNWNTDKLRHVLHFYTSCSPPASCDRRLTPCNSDWQHLIEPN